MGDEYRPVTLRKVVLGYPFSENSSDFKFDMSLDYKLSGVIQTYSDNKPTIVVYFLLFLFINFIVLYSKNPRIRHVNLEHRCLILDDKPFI